MRSSDQRGFTLIELLVVIAIIAILAAILFPVLTRAKEAGRMSACHSNMKQISLALLTYVDDWGGRLPNVGNGLNHAYHGRFLHMSVGGDGQGPYIQDLLGKYTKNKDVWLCKSLKPSELVPLGYGGSGNTRYYWKDNRGAYIQYRDWCTNYYWLHRKPHRTKGEWYILSGMQASNAVNATKALTFMEMPHWGQDSAAPDQTPHQKNSREFLINMAFLDGHVKRFLCGQHGWEVAVRMNGWD